MSANTQFAAIVADMLRSRAHHLYVTNDEGTIVGVISTCDVLRHLD